MNVPQADVVMTQFKKRFGLIAARIGASFVHKIGVAMTLEAPEYATATKAVGARTRTRVTQQSSLFEYGKNPLDGSRCATRALPGASVQLEVQDISKLEPEEAKLLKWVCNHRECQGKRWNSKEEMVRAHGKQKDLIEDAERDPHGQPHVYYAVLEIAGTPDKEEVKDPKTGKVLEPAVAGEPATILICSDEE